MKYINQRNFSSIIYGYIPDKTQMATEPVLEQAKILSEKGVSSGEELPDMSRHIVELTYGFAVADKKEGYESGKKHG